jgi:integrase
VIGSRLARPAIRSKTYHGYAQIVRLYLKPELGRIVLSKLEPQDVQSMLNRLVERGLSARTVSHVHARLRGALNQAVKWGMVTCNVAALVDPPRVPHSEVTPLDPQQARRLLEALEGERLQALFAVPLAAGLRPSEALGLRWQDVDFDAGTISVFHGVQRLEGKLRLQELKTRRSRRSISLPSSVLDLLRAHQARQQEARTLLGPEWKDTGLFFTTWFGTALEPRNVVRSFKRILQKAGLTDIRFYDLRHTCASLLLAQGVPSMGGHGDPGAQPDQSDDEHLQPRDPTAAARSRVETGRAAARMMPDGLAVKLAVNRLQNKKATPHRY